MSKIIKHTFNIPNLSVKDGELVEGNPITKTYTFTLLYRGIGLYEEIAKEPLFNSLLDCIGKENDIENAKNLLNKDFIKTLACVSYCKIDGDKFHNNRATCEEFKKTPVYPLIEQDFEFITKLISMAMECCYDNEKSKKNSEVSRSKK